VSAEMISSDGQMVYFGISKADMQANKSERNIFRIPALGGTLQQVTKEAGNETDLQSTKDGRIIFTYNDQVWIMNADGSNRQAITTGANTYSTLKVSPDGKKILFSRDVKTRSTTKDIYPDLEKANAKIIDNLMYRHWANWEDENVSHIFIADLINNTVSNEKDIMEGEAFDCPQQPEGGPEDIIWSPDSKSIYYVCKKKIGKDYSLSTNTDIYVYDVASGNTTDFTTAMKGYDTSPVFSGDGKSIAWLSMATDGYEADKNDIILYRFATQQTYNLTKSWDGTVNSFRFSADNSKIYFTADIKGTVQLFELTIPQDPTKSNTSFARQIT